MRTLDPQDPAVTYAAVLDALPIVAFMANPAGEITYVSRAWERLTGRARREIVEAGYQLVIHPDDLAHVVATWSSGRGAGVGYRDEFRLRFGDGGFRWVLSQADPMRSHEGTIVGWFGTLTDIHALRLAEEATRRASSAAAHSAREADARARFVERLLDASDDCINVLDAQGRLLSMSPNGQKALGIGDFAQVAGSDWLDFWPGDDRAAAAEAVSAARAGERSRFTAMYAVDGVARWWEVTISPIAGADGRPQELLAVLRDVTETLVTQRSLLQSQERYRVLGEALPGITWTATPDGRLDYVGGSLSAAVAADALGEGWLATVHPDDRQAVQARWEASISGGVPYDAQFRARRGDRYRWQLVRALPQRDESGAILRWVGVNVDIDDQRRADEAREQFVRLVEASDDFIAISDLDGKPTYVNEAGRRLLEIRSLDEACSTNLVEYFAPADRAYVVEHILPAIHREGRWLGEYRFRNFRTGASIPVWYNVFALNDERGQPMGIATVSRDVRERYRVEVGMHALAEAGAAMYESLDLEGTVKNVAAAVARSFSTFCTVDIIGSDGKLVSVVAGHRDAAIVALLERAVSARTLNSDHPVLRALHHGESTLLSTLPVDWLDLIGVDAREAGGLDVQSLIFVPIRSSQDGLVCGALTCMLAGSDPRGGYTLDDVPFAQEIAGRAGLAFDHARAYQRERRIAMTLQEASLPTVLPSVGELYLSADYRPGNTEATIGGDWYDAFLLDDGRIAFTVGDVLGKGLNAAVTMGKVRQAMRAVATVLPDPNAMLDVADRTIRAESADAYATAMAGIFDVERGEYLFASAGHPGPAVRHTDGRIDEYNIPSLLLGLRPRGSTQTMTIEAPPGTSLVFFTDGLVEATRDIDEGHRRLHAALLDPAVSVALDPAHALVEHVLRGDPVTDDIAVLIVDVGPSPRFGDRRRVLPVDSAR